MQIGDPQAGKSSVLYDVAARVTRGAAMPDQPVSSTSPPGRVLFLEAEDPPQVVRARLRAAGADLERVSIPGPGDAGTPCQLPDDIGRIEAHARQQGVDLIVISPLAASIRTNLHSDGAVRRALQPLVAMAQRLNAAVVLVNHLTKASQRSVLHAGAGSMGIVALARSVLLVAEDPTDDTHRLLLPLKNSFAAPAAPLGFRIVSKGDSTVVEWTGQADAAVMELMAPRRPGGRELWEAMRVLYSILGEGPVLVKDVECVAASAGVANRTLRRAKDAMGAKSRKVGFGPGSRYYWHLPSTGAVVERLKLAEIDEVTDRLVNGDDPDAWPPEPGGSTPKRKRSDDTRRRHHGPDTDDLPPPDPADQ